MFPIPPRPSRNERRRYAKLRRRDARWMREYWSRPYPSCYICDARTGPFQVIVAGDPHGPDAELFPLVCLACAEELKQARPEFFKNMKPLDGIRFEEAAPK
jgi:hypothetical protein